MTPAIGFAQMPWSMVQVRCRRCKKIVASCLASQDGSGPYGMGKWQHRGRRECRCNPPVVLPEGEQLAVLLKRAREKRASGSRHGVSIYK